MNAQWFVVSRFFIGLTVLFLLTGCAAFQPAASIRVEVDVYKGPLSKPLEIQKAELVGIIKEAVIVGDQFDLILETVDKCVLIIGPYSAERCTALRELASQLKKKSKESFSKLRDFYTLSSEKNEKKYRAALVDLAEIAAQMKTQSAATVASMVPYVTSDEALRIAQSIFAVMSSEFGNLIGSRVDALMTQQYGYEDKVGDNGPISRSQLHLSKYLSDSSVTKVPNLYEWYNAKVPGMIEEWNYFIPGNNPSMRERVRIYETIFNDIYWSNVNTVYASGVDKVNMALIRDEIGNWNLKNFDNDPTELLGAYKNLTIQSINTAIELAGKSASGGSLELAQRAANIANRIASRLDDTGPPTVPVAKYKQRVVAQLESLKQTSQAEWDAMNCKSAATDDQKASCKEILKTMNKKIKDLLQDYSIVLDTLQEVSLPATPKKTEANVPTL